MISQFALRLLCGMSLMWSVMPRAQVTSGFFRIQMLVALGLSVLAALASGQMTTATPGGAPLLSGDVLQWAFAGLGVCAFLGSVMWTLERRGAGAWFVFVIAAASSVMLLLSVSSIGMFSGMAGELQIAGGTSGVEAARLAAGLRLVSELSSAALLGGAMTGMLLGHWYLTAPTMSIAPLSRLNAFFGAAALLRLVVSTAGLLLAWDALGSQTHLIWLSMRWLAGVIGPLIVFVMVWRILKYKNTQAATGVLFVGVILTFIGEMTASLLYQELLAPL
jgi:hypothetical protein